PDRRTLGGEPSRGPIDHHWREQAEPDDAHQHEGQAAPGHNPPATATAPAHHVLVSGRAMHRAAPDPHRSLPTIGSMPHRSTCTNLQDLPGPPQGIAPSMPELHVPLTIVR